MKPENVLVISKKTQHEFDTEKYGTAVEKIYLKRDVIAGKREYDTILKNHQEQYDALKKLENALKNKNIKYDLILKQEHSEDDFNSRDLIISFGGDGTLLSIAGYILDEKLVLGLKSCPSSGGCLLSTEKYNTDEKIDKILNDEFKVHKYTRLEMKINENGPWDLAVNDIIIGKKYPQSPAHYYLTCKGKTEKQTSSGVLIATGTGSTAFYGNITQRKWKLFAANGKPFPRDSLEARFVVINPETKERNRCTITSGILKKEESIKITSHMNCYGIIAVDGFVPESNEKQDHKKNREYDFERGNSVEIKISNKPLHVVSFE